MLAGLATGFAIAEGTIRLCLFTPACNITYLNGAGDFFDPLTESFWLLHHRLGGVRPPWKAGWRTKDPLLGWDFKKNLNTGCVQTNNLGGQEYDTLFDQQLVPSVLFYGDSFVDTLIRDFICTQKTLPAFLELELKRNVVNFGVAGYGLDQIYLKFLKTHNKYEKPLVLVGIILDDLNRSALQGLRNGPKPYFLAGADDELVLQGVPISDNPEEYFETHPIPLGSYLWRRFLRTRFGYPIEERLLRPRIESMQKINREIIKRFAETTKNEGASLGFVIFYPERELTPDWRHTFLLKTLKEFGVPYIDTKRYLLEYANGEEKKYKDLYFNDDGHHNIFGNHYIATRLAQDITRFGWLPGEKKPADATSR